MKMLCFVMLILTSFFIINAMEWAEYEMLCNVNGKEASYEEYKYLAEEGATDWGTEDVNLEDLIDNGEVEEK